MLKREALFLSLSLGDTRIQLYEIENHFCRHRPSQSSRMSFCGDKRPHSNTAPADGRAQVAQAPVPRPVSRHIAHYHTGGRMNLLAVRRRLLHLSLPIHTRPRSPEKGCTSASIQLAADGRSLIANSAVVKPIRQLQMYIYEGVGFCAPRLLRRRSIRWWIPNVLPFVYSSATNRLR